MRNIKIFLFYLKYFYKVNSKFNGELSDVFLNKKETEYTEIEKIIVRDKFANFILVLFCCCYYCFSFK
mgnify:CR=1 FL=1